jgi:MaoC like domain
VTTGEAQVGDDGPTYSAVSVGDVLPTLVLPITRTLIVSGAIASRDYQDVHHDSVLAKERGSKDIFMNILTTNGLVGRYVTDWSGPRSRLSAVDIRLGAPNYPDCTMTLTGTVTDKGPVDDDGTRGTVTVTIRGANDLGDHVTGTVDVVLPLGDAH